MKALLLRRPGPEGEQAHVENNEDLEDVKVIHQLDQVLAYTEWSVMDRFSEDRFWMWWGERVNRYNIRQTPLLVWLSVPLTQGLLLWHQVWGQSTVSPEGPAAWSCSKTAKSGVKYRNVTSSSWEKKIKSSHRTDLKQDALPNTMVCRMTFHSLWQSKGAPRVDFTDSSFTVHHATLQNVMHIYAFQRICTPNCFSTLF